MMFSLPNCFEVMAKGVCKGTALGEVLKRKGLGYQDAMAFGDGMNDLGMLSQVGKGLLMSNADPDLVTQLPQHERVGENNQDGVACYLERYYAQYGLI